MLLVPIVSSPRVHPAQDPTNVSVFDPVFVDRDRELLAQRRLTVLPEDFVRLQAYRFRLIIPPRPIVSPCRACLSYLC